MYVSVDCPGAGRVKLILSDCTTKDLKCSDGLHFTGNDSAETYWHAVDAGTLQYNIATDFNKNNVKINPEATLTAKFESINDYNGELVGNHSFDTATSMKLNTLYEGSIVGQDSEDDYYKFVMDKPGKIMVTCSGYPFSAV